MPASNPADAVREALSPIDAAVLLADLRSMGRDGWIAADAAANHITALTARADAAEAAAVFLARQCAEWQDKAEAHARDAALWSKWLPWLSRLNRKPFNLAMDVNAAMQEPQP